MGRVGTYKAVTLVTEDGENALEATVDFGANDVATAAQYAPAGFISKGINGDLAAAMLVEESENSEEYVVVGYVDVTLADLVADGESLMYARDEDGEVVASMHVKADGSVAVVATGPIRIENGDGFIEVAASGQVNANGHLTVDP